MADLSDSDVDDSVEGYKNAGNECMRKQKYNAAIDNYRRGLKLDPKNAVLNCNLAQAYLNKKEFTEAEKFANVAIEAQSDYVKGYYRAARAALGRHNVYDSMMYLADGVSKCSSQGLEDLFAMARELSPEFESYLRRCPKPTTPSEKPAASKPSESQPSKKTKKASKLDDTSLGKRVDGQKDEKEDWQRKLDEKSEKKRKLEEKQELLKRQNEAIADELAKETKELEQLQKEKEKKEQERKDREKKEQEKRERERKENEKREQERVEREMRERKEQEKRDHEKKEQEKRDREKREQEKRDREKKEAEKKAREQAEYNRKLLEIQKKKAKEEKVKKEQERVAALKRDIQDNMREGSLALMKGLGRKAVDNLEKALDTIKSHPPAENLGFSDHMDLVALQYTYCKALILSGEYKYIVKGIKLLENMELEGMLNKFPAIFLLLGKAFVRLNRFKEAQQPVNRGLSFLNRGTSFICYPWPGTNEVMETTERKFLKEALESELLNCKIYHKPDAVCYSENCLTTSQHIIPSRDIFFSDPDFNGFVTIICQENCHIHFHVPCWKDYKENLSIEKLSEKDFLGRECFTPDCRKKFPSEERAVILKIAIIGPDGEEKSKCECAPPQPAVPPSNESTSIKSPVKKSRKKEQDKNNKLDTSKKRRTRCDSKTQGDLQIDNPVVKQNSQGQQYADALSKLAAARENNFGYDISSPNPHKPLETISVPPHLSPNEEFIYSYFMEIFKKNGHMSILQLQEHWETNKELLPELEPALVTHTDLVKFLLDTKGVAVVQDVIGIANELPQISAVVESKCDPLPAVYGWQFSAATMQEASQTLSFNSALPESFHPQDPRAEDFNKLDKSSSSSSYYSTHENDKEEDIPHCALTEPLSAPSLMNHSSNQEESKPVNNDVSSDNGINGTDSYHTSDTSDTCDENCNLAPLVVTPKPQSSKPIMANNHIKPVSGKNRLSNLPAVCAPPLVNESVELSGKLEKLDIKSEFKLSLPQALNKPQDTQSAEPSSPRAAWKPRAKLLEWASETFPGESKATLWEALTKVRAGNNYTLSGLSFDAIAERVKAVLQESDSA